MIRAEIRKAIPMSDSSKKNEQTTGANSVAARRIVSLPRMRNAGRGFKRSFSLVARAREEEFHGVQLVLLHE